MYLQSTSTNDEATGRIRAFTPRRREAFEGAREDVQGKERRAITVSPNFLRFHHFHHNLFSPNSPLTRRRLRERVRSSPTFGRTHAGRTRGDKGLGSPRPLHGGDDYIILGQLGDALMGYLRSLGQFLPFCVYLVTPTAF